MIVFNVIFLKNNLRIICSYKDPFLMKMLLLGGPENASYVHLKQNYYSFCKISSFFATFHQGVSNRFDLVKSTLKTKPQSIP